MQQRLERISSIAYVDCNGHEQVIYGLPARQRDRWILLLKEFRELRQKLAEKNSGLTFGQYYDQFTIDGTVNRKHSVQFRRYVDQLCEMHGVDPGKINADIAIQLLINYDDSGMGLLEILEFPQMPAPDDGDVLEPPEGIDPDDWEAALISAYAGGPNQAQEWVDKKPYVDLLAEMQAAAKLSKMQLEEAENRAKGHKKPRQQKPQQPGNIEAEVLSKLRGMHSGDMSIFAPPVVPPGLKNGSNHS